MVQWRIGCIFFHHPNLSRHIPKWSHNYIVYDIIFYDIAMGWFKFVFEVVFSVLVIQSTRNFFWMLGPTYSNNPNNWLFGISNIIVSWIYHNLVGFETSQSYPPWFEICFSLNRMIYFQYIAQGDNINLNVSRQIFNLEDITFQDIFNEMPFVDDFNITKRQHK